MNFDFSAEQKALAEQARRFLAAECPSSAVRAVMDSDRKHDARLWKGLAEMGFLGIVIPERFGGLGLSHLELCVVAEELGRALAPVPFSSSVYLATEFQVRPRSRSAGCPAWPVASPSGHSHLQSRPVRSRRNPSGCGRKQG